MKGRVLLVDGNPAVTKCLSAVLQAEGHQTTVVPTAAEAVDRLRAGSFDVILAEPGIQAGSCEQLWQQAESRSPALEVILLAGFQVCLNSGDACNPGETRNRSGKPVETLQELVVAVRHAIEKRRLRQENGRLLEALRQQQRDLRKMEQQSGSARRRYFSLFEDAPVAYLVLDPSNRIVDINRAGRTLFGLTEPSRPYPLFTEWVDAEWRQACREHLVRARRQKGGYSWELKVIGAGGESLDVLVRSLARCAPDGRCEPLPIVLLDMREQKRAEQSLLKREARFRSLFETMPQGVIFQDAEGRITSVNPAAARILGMPSEQLLGRDCSAFSRRALDQWGEPLEVERHPSRIALRTGKTVSNAIVGTFNPTANETRWLRVHAVPCFAGGNSRPSQIFTSFDDVTQLMRIEDALRKSEDRYRDLMETIPQGLEEIDLNGTILYSNPAHCRMHGYHPGSLVGRSILDFRTLEHTGQTLREHLRSLAREQVSPAPYRGKDRCADGSEIHVQIDWNYRRDSRGQVTGFIAVISDVTSSRLAQKALQDSERRYRELVEQAAEGICVVSRDCSFLELNPRLCAILGYEQEELLHTPVGRILDEPEWPQQLPDLQRLEPGSSFTGECKARRKNGEPFYAAFSAKVLQDQRVQAIVRDVTERKIAEQQLLESKNRFKETVDLVPNMICEIDQDLMLTYANRLGLETLGYTRDDLRAGVHVLDLMDPGERARAKKVFSRIASGEELKPAEMSLLKRDGSRIEALVNAVAMVRSGKFTGYRISLMDITDFKKLAKQLQDARNFEAIATLAGGIAHQFNNALAVIKGSTELLQMAGEESANRDNLLAHIETATERLTGLTAQLLAYARGGRYQPETVNAIEMVRQCLGLVGHAIAPGIVLDLRLEPSDMLIEVDLTQMQMVLSAVLENASEAVAEDGTIVVAVEPQPLTIARTDARRRPEGCYVHILVEDHGKGMNEQEQERIFDPFFTTKFQGRGLGMAAAYGIVRNHQGWMEVESAPGEGTRIHIFLPLAQEQPSREEFIEPEPESPDKVQTVLVIDDEPELLAITQEILEVLGYRVLVADSGRASLQLLERHRGEIDLVLLDLILMDLPAKSVCRRLLERYPNVRIIVCSGYSLDGPAKDLLASGAHGFLQKPFALSDLEESLKQALA